MTPQQIADCMSDLLTFTQVMFRARKGVDMRYNWHQKAICDALERVVLGKTKRLIINIPPRSGKTELAVLNFIAWATGIFPDSEWIHASYSKRLATNNAYGVREIMRHEVYQQIFPAVQIRSDSSAKDEFRTEQGGIVYATGAEGSITGRGAGGMSGRFQGAIIVDDPHKPGEANSATMRQNVLDWFSTTMESRKNSPDTPIIIIMQRLHESDLSGFLLAGGNGEEWEHLNIPAETESGTFWPEQFPQDMLDRLKQSSSYVYAGQYLQQPAPIGGGIFKTAWTRHWQTLPQLEYRAIYADTAMKTGEENDFSVFQHWGRGVDGKAYLLDMVRGKWEAPQLLAQAKAFWDKCQNQHTGALRKFKVEDKASGTGLIQQLKQSGVPVEGIPRNKDKISRAYDTAPMMEAGNVMLPERNEHLSDLLNELALFPAATHDDCIDPLMDAVQDMLVKNNKLPEVTFNFRF